VRIAASEVVGVEVLPPILAALRARHPGLVLELVASDAVEDLLRRDADIAVRMVAPRQEALLARRLGTIALGLHAHRTYLDRRGTPASPDELAGHDLIGFGSETHSIRAMRARTPAAFARFLHPAAFALRADSTLAQLAAIRAGFGIGICQVPLAVSNPGLLRVLPDFGLELPTWLVMHEDLKSSLRCRVVFDALADGLRPHLTPPRP
jgi:DNA-binding transcriptional LysR family regulator